jgi:tRNA A-37 threonylcarbamoyl transferase component Bud32
MKSSPVQQVEVHSCQRGGIAWTIRATDGDAELRAVLENPDSFLTDATLHFKSSRNVTVARIPRAGKTGWVLRRLNYGKLSHRLRDSLRPTRAHRAFKSGLRLEEAGVPTARVLAAGEVRRLRWPLRSYLLTEEIPGAVTLTGLLAQKHSQTRLAVRRLAEVLARLHDGGFSHRDLKAANMLFDDQLHAHLIDLDGLRRIRLAARSRAAGDLARLARDITSEPAVSLRLAVLFLKTYCRSRGLADWRWWWRAIEQRLQR